MTDAKYLIERGAQLWKERMAITTLWQEIAENFYPERADFTIRRKVGSDFNDFSHPLKLSHFAIACSCSGKRYLPRQMNVRSAMLPWALIPDW